ncbi:MAG: AAA family ATPase [Chitinophagales bacterium]
MILVDQIRIKEFRGIRDITLILKGKNFAICGPNGTGKSGVVDALEFALTGNISRLSGGGTGAISLKKHAPHVDYRDDPGKATVKVNLRIPSLGNKMVSIERNVKNALSPIIIPDTQDVLEVLTQLENHPEFVLSRRELIAYVLAQPVKRSQEIQALLQLNKVGELRNTFKTISNSCNGDYTALKKVSDAAGDNLAKALDITELKSENILHAANTRRTILGLPLIDTFTATTMLSDGLTTIAKASTAPKINKAEALLDFKNIRQLLQVWGKQLFIEQCEEAQKELSTLANDPAIAGGISKDQFLRNAISYLTERACPVCDTEWEIVTLRGLLEGKLKRFEEASAKKSATEKKLSPIIGEIQKLSASILLIEKHAKILSPEKVSILVNYRSNLETKIKSLRNFLPLNESISALNDISLIPEDFTIAMNFIETLMSAIPDPSDIDAARDYLILCDDRLKSWRAAKRNAKQAEDKAELAITVYDTYVRESNGVLESIYKEVEDEFGSFYRAINSEDEGTFTAKLTPSMGKLDFDVEFYGRGHFPPGAYHSEGHQDGMGLCLYLALMKRLQGSNFRFAVLDDVLMSVDTGHRKEVCNLLKKNFPDTQFILTTHDEVWLKHMASAGLIDSNNTVHFSNWTPELGPTEWKNRDVWKEIETALKVDDVRLAAGLLRYYCEHIFKDICHNLKAPVEFKGDGRYDLGDVLSPGVKKLRKILVDGSKAALSWSNTAEAELVTNREKYIAACLAASNAEQWQVNPAIHYNEWANLTAADFTPVAEAFHNLINNFFCPKEECNSLYYLTFTTPKEADTLRCDCGAININLKKKKTF